MGAGGEKSKMKIQGKNEKGERKKEKITLKKGGKGLKNASFWAIISKKFQMKPDIQPDTQPDTGYQKDRISCQPDSRYNPNTV